MKKILLGFMLFLSTMTFAGELPTKVTFEKGNYFAITSSFNQGLLDRFTESVLNYEGDEMYIYFDTPGGSVIALASMARIMKASDIKFTCVAKFAASAGFMLFQHCDRRLVTSDGILMSHNWSGGFSDEGPRILTMYNAIQSLIDTLEAVAIEKMNVDKKEYLSLINNNLWMPYPLAQKYAAIDGVIDNLGCSKELIRQRIRVTQRSFFGGSNVYYKSGCPLIQKTYIKSKSRRSGEYVENNETLFNMAQKGYKLEQVNLFYDGKKK